MVLKGALNNRERDCRFFYSYIFKFGHLSKGFCRTLMRSTYYVQIFEDRRVVQIPAAFK